MDIISQRRGKNAAILGLLFQIAATLAMLVVWIRTDSLAATSACWLLAGGAPLWLMAAVLFYCRQLQLRESLELEEISTRAAGGTIFEAQTDATLRPAANRLAWVLRWIVPIFTLLFAAYSVAMGAVMLRYLGQDAVGSLSHTPGEVVTQGLVFCIIGWFLGLLLSRYATGMGGQETYRPLRAAGSYLLVNVLAISAVIAALAFAHYGNAHVDKVVAYVIPLTQLVLALELSLNFVLDIYRPRVPGQEQRLAFDSRLFNLAADPGRVGHSIAETLNYQFGFEVSKTWFYQLLSRAMAPMLILGALVLLAMTSIVIVPQGEQALIFHWGKVVRQVKAGQYLKLPWPVDTVQRFNVKKIHDVYLGTGDARGPDEIKKNLVNGHVMALWTEEHGLMKEKDFLVAVPPETARKSGLVSDNTPAVNIIKLTVLVQYRIKDPIKYGYKYDNPDEQIQCLAYREMVRYLASATLLDRVDSSDRPQAVMTGGRQAAENELMRRIKRAVEDDVGVEVVYVGIQGIHPSAEAGLDAATAEVPKTCATAYEAVMEAERQQDQKRYQAEAEANQALAKAAGSPGQALMLAMAIRQQRQLDGMARAKAQELPGRADEAIAISREELRTVDGEIERDRLLGKGVAGAAAQSGEGGTSVDWRAIRKEYVDYIDTLGQIKAGRPGKLAQALAAANERADALFKDATGQPASLEADAQAQRWTAELAERATAENFQRELAAYANAPNIFILDRYLDVYDQVLPTLPKYIFAVDRNKIDLRVDMRTEAQPMEGAMEKDAGK